VSPEEFPGVVAGDGFYFGLVNGVGRIGERRGGGEVKALRLRVVSGICLLPNVRVVEVREPSRPASQVL
jgi:hypothetical protein